MAAVRKRIWTVDGETKVGWFCDWYDSKGQRQRKSFAYKKQADAFRIKIESQLLDGSYRAGGDKINIKDACEAFLLYCQGRNARDERMSTKNLVVYRGHIKKHVLNPRHGIHQMVLSHLTARAVSGFRDSLRNHGMTVPTARKVLGTLGSILQFCVQQDWIATNPARGIRVIGNRTEGSKKIVPPSKASMGALIKSADEDLKLMLVFACSTGARAGEQWAARWRDIDFDGGEYNICRRVDAYGEEGPPKSGAGIRTVPISAQLVSLLKAWRLRSHPAR
jgi:integrase